MYYRSKAPKLSQQMPIARKEINTDVVVKIKNKMKVLDFVRLYVDLKPTGKGAVGLCPFHDDQHTSFSVNNNENYWHCFAGCGGGSVIDFWMKWKSCDFAEAVKELETMLLP